MCCKVSICLVFPASLQPWGTQVLPVPLGLGLERASGATGYRRGPSPQASVPASGA